MVATDSSARMREDFANPFASRAHLIHQMRGLILFVVVLLLLTLGALEVVASRRAPFSEPLPPAQSMFVGEE